MAVCRLSTSTRDSVLHAASFRLHSEMNIPPVDLLSIHSALHSASIPPALRPPPPLRLLPLLPHVLSDSLPADPPSSPPSASGHPPGLLYAVYKVPVPAVRRPCLRQYSTPRPLPSSSACICPLTGVHMRGGKCWPSSLGLLALVLLNVQLTGL